VADNGKGIDPDEAQVIFEPFRQSRGNNARHGGIGLGLATCKRIVERHGGKIWAESKPGTGAVFSFTLPGAGGAGGLAGKTFPVQAASSTHSLAAGVRV